VSALDARIRHLAREELAAAGAPSATAGPDRVAELEQQLADLTARVEELEQAPTAAKRAARKTAPGTSG
jgi:hypothetical protein